MLSCYEGCVRSTVRGPKVVNAFSDIAIFRLSHSRAHSPNGVRGLSDSRRYRALTFSLQHLDCCTDRAVRALLAYFGAESVGNGTPSFFWLQAAGLGLRGGELLALSSDRTHPLAFEDASVTQKWQIGLLVVFGCVLETT